MSYELANRTTRQVLPGQPYPLGATLNAEGVNFALYSRNAAEVFVLLFDQGKTDPTDIIRLPHRTRFVWHAFVPGLRAGQLYGYKVRGDYRPELGLRFNEHKLLLDPYARAVSGKFHNTENLLLAYDPLSPSRDLSFDMRDNDAIAPKAIVNDDRFDWAGDNQPDIPLEKLIIYEVHLKGFTAHTSSRVAHPGTYLGFIEKIPHLLSLGINAVELLPVQEFYVDDFLLARGMTNYWGYNTIGFFAPESSYSTQRFPGCQVEEFKILVRELHRAGIEVILDVVYNHSGEGNELGPTLCFKGIDNPSYYCLTGSRHQPQRYYMNYTGCGNSLNLDSQSAIRLVMDSLRYWVEVMHVDGFRFDLASVLGRYGPEDRFHSTAFDLRTNVTVEELVRQFCQRREPGAPSPGILLGASSLDGVRARGAPALAAPAEVAQAPPAAAQADEDWNRDQHRQQRHGHQKLRSYPQPPSFGGVDQRGDEVGEDEQ